MLKGFLNFEKAIPFLKIKYFEEKHGPFKILKTLKILKILQGRSLAFKILRILRILQAFQKFKRPFKNLNGLLNF